MRTALMAGLAVLAAPAMAADLDVRVSGIRDDTGHVRIMLFDRAEGFRKEDQARAVLTLPAAAGTIDGRFDGLPPGRYAAIAYHDENDSGRLDLRLGMFPAEGHGLSNNPRIYGPPRFDDASFDLPDGGSRVEIELAY